MTRVSAFPLPDVLPAPAPSVPAVLTLVRGWPRILAALVLCAGLSAAYVFLAATPVYRSSVTMMLEPQEPKVIDLAVVLPALGRDSQILNTQVEVLRSRPLIGGLVDRQRLTADPEFNAAIRQPGPFHPRPLWQWGATALGVPTTPPAAPPSAMAQREATIDAVLRRLEIAIEPESLVIRVAARTGDPAKTALILNDLAETYVADQLAAKRRATEEATRWLTDRVVELKASLEAAEQRARAARAEAAQATPETAAELERRLAALRLRRDSPRIGDSVAKVLDREIDQASRKLVEVSERLIAIAQLDREAAATALLYETFLSRLKETSIQAGVQRPDVRILSPAIHPLRPHAPNVALYLVLAMILGTGLGAAWVLAREEWRIRFRTSEDVERATSIPVLATLPSQADKRRDPVSELTRCPASDASEAIRTLRSSILLSNIDRPPKVVTLTSSISGEGKSTTTLMLAETLAAWGKTVLVIEADVRAATFQTRFHIAEQRGVLSVLADLCPLEDVLFRPPGHSFDVLPGEATAAHAADVFATGRFSQFVKEMRLRFDYILIDTPPVLAAADARVIGACSDAVVYLVRWNRTTRSQLRRGLSQFQGFGQPVTGIVLTRAPAQRRATYASRQR